MRKNYFYLSLLIVTILFIQACNDSFTNPKDETEREVSAEVTELQQYLHPINSTSPESSLDDLFPLANIGEAQVIGLGEATHGTKEFFEMKHKIFKYLVENHGFRVFAFEADMAESIYINRYVQGESADLTELMKTRMQFWTWRTEEVRDLLEWMRSYNEGKPDSEKLHYIGVDCQYLTFQPDLIEDYIQEVQPTLLQETQDVLRNIRALGPPQTYFQRYSEMPHEEFRAIRDTLTYLVDRMNEFKEDLIAKSSQYEFQTHLQLVRNLQQTHIVRYPSDNRIASYRDLFMAINTLWIPNLLGADTKIAVWAHNFHIQTPNNYWMGGYLRNNLGDQYKTIGFSFGKGSFVAAGFTSYGKNTGLQSHTITAEPLKNSLTALFHGAEPNDFILNLDEIPLNSILHDYFLTPRELMIIAAGYNSNPSDYYWTTVLKNAYNSMIYIDETSAAEQLN